jgi:hypothetical protein
MEPVIKQELDALAGETLALQVILTNVLYRLRIIDPRLADAIVAALDDAANQVEDLAIHFGKTASSEHTVKAIRIVEELRTAVLGDHDKPRSGI